MLAEVAAQLPFPSVQLHPPPSPHLPASLVSSPLTHFRLHAFRQATASDFEARVLPLAGRYPHRVRAPHFTLQNFRRAAAYLASRGFCVDEEHGDSMVPFADIFNHKAAVVAPGADYEVHGAEGGGSDSDGGGIEGGEEGLVLRKGEARVHGLSSAGGQSLRMEIAIIDREVGACV